MTRLPLLSAGIVGWLILLAGACGGTGRKAGPEAGVGGVAPGGVSGNGGVQVTGGQSGGGGLLLTAGTSGGTVLGGSGGGGGAGGSGGTGGVSTETGVCGGGSISRVPANHRATEGPACPNDRAPGGIPAMCTPDPDAGVAVEGDCQQDSDCNAGINGRCIQLRPYACFMVCSYDTCFNDSDCAGNVPCNCRDSASSTDSNRCLSNSNCRVDDDCGSGGYCSPSQLSGCIRMCTVPCDSDTHCYAGATEVPCWCGQNCGDGYFCHTADDTCTNDCECNVGDSACTHAPGAAWACIPCGMIP